MAQALPKPHAKTTVQTLLTLPASLYRRIKDQADKDKRTVRPEIEILLEEAVAAREAK